MRKALGVALGAGLLLLLLSALVVAMPQDGAAPRRPQPPSAPPDAVLTAAALPDGAQPPQAVSGGWSARTGVRMDLPPQDIAMGGPDGRRDANGRVITAARYAASVYQVFRAEAAGG